jgi:haloalkane dehalogenase
MNDEANFLSRVVKLFIAAGVVVIIAACTTTGTTPTPTPMPSAASAAATSATLPYIEPKITEVFRTPDIHFQNLPGYNFQPNYVYVEPNIRMHYVDEGPKNGELIVLLHGQPTWSYIYRNMIPVLAKAGYRVVAPDLIGYGKSDKPAAMADYTYARHVEWVQRFIAQLKLEKINLVVHDWGGMIGIRVAALQPSLIRRLTLMDTSFNNGYEVYTPRYAEGFARWRAHLRETKDLKFGPAIAVNIFTPPAAGVLEAYDAPYPDDRYKAGARIMSSLIPITPEQAGAPENRRLEPVLNQWKTPVLIAFTATSERVHPGQRKRFLDLFPASVIWRNAAIEDAKHYMQESKSQEIAELIVEFIKATKS